MPYTTLFRSGMARKQMARSLPEDWDIALSYAAGGEECLEHIQNGYGEIVFLDLNMPGTDGYAVLQRIHDEELPAMVIVVSGDVQPEARTRVKRLGAIEFIKKPIDTEQLSQLLAQYGLYAPDDSAATPSQPVPPGSDEVEWTDALQETANVAMGQAGDLLARLLNVFVELPVPSVNMLEASELRMALTVAENGDTWSGVCQGFIGSGIAGEALLLFSDSRIDAMSKLLGHVEDEDANRDVEVLMDMSSILVGAFLKGFGQQLDLHFGISHPVVLGTHVDIEDLLESNSGRWQKMLAIELNYSIEQHDIRCDLLLLFTEESIAPLREIFQWLAEPA